MSEATHLKANRVLLLTLALGLMSACETSTGSSGKLNQSTVRCRPPSGFSGSPTTIGEAMALANALPKPTSVACFLEALDRPLRIIATTNRASAQPAVSDRIPRIFIIVGNLILSVVPNVNGESAMEFGEITSSSQSVKGEIAFPLLTPLPYESPFTRIRFQYGTGCVFCHQNETRAPDTPTRTQAYNSDIIPVDPTMEVSVARIIGYARSCNSTTEPGRCAILRAIVGPNEDVSRGSF